MVSSPGVKSKYGTADSFRTLYRLFICLRLVCFYSDLITMCQPSNKSFFQMST